MIIKAIEKLVNYGMDFEYENRGSEGEEVKSFELGMDINIQKGKIYLSHEGSFFKTEETEEAYHVLANKVEEICIHETASF